MSSLRRLAARLFTPTRPARRPLRLWVEFLESRDVPSVYSQLRVVDYNIGGDVRNGFSTVFQDIGNQNVAGLARPVDILLLEESDSQATDTQAAVNVLNTLYGSGTYARGTVDGSTSGAGRPGIVYRVSSVDLISETPLSVAGAERAPMRYQIRPDGLDSTYDFYIYVSHYKASQGFEAQRNQEAQGIRANADALGQGAEILYVGDFNTYTSTEAMYQTLLGSGNGQAFDPINRPGDWHDGASFKSIHTQSPATTAFYGSQITGGMDDRFDHVMNTQEVGASGTASDNLGLEYRAGSYRAFGNNGTHTISGAITTGSGAAAATLTALSQISDHIPVVVDYDVVIPDGGDTTPPTIAPANFVDNVAGGPVNVNQLVTYTLTFSEDILNGSFTAADLNNAGTAAISIGTITETSNGVFTVQVTPTTAGTLILRIPTGAVVQDVAGNLLAVPVQDNTTITVNGPVTVLQVSSFTATGGGFRVVLNAAPDLTTLNAYDLLSTAGVQAPDVTVTLSGNPVSGSLVRDLSDATNRTWTWIGTGVGTTGVLAAGTYNVTLRSDTTVTGGINDGWTSATLGDLDGDANGTAGGNYTNSFTVAATRSLAVGNFVLGPGQPAASDPNYATFQVPITISEQSGVEVIQFDLVYDPTLVTLFSGGSGLVITPAGLAAGYTAAQSGLNPTFNTTNPRAYVARFGFTQLTANVTGAVTLATFQVAVPTSAANQYAEKQVLRMTNLVVNGVNGGPLSARADDAIHVNAYLGDTSGNGGISPSDASLIVQLFGQANATFDAFQLLDPVLIADTTANGAVSPTDASLVVQEFGNPAATNIPNVPSGVGTITPSGPDPTLYVGSGLTVAPGGAVTVPVMVDVSEAAGITLSSFSIVLSFDRTKFDASALATATTAELIGPLLSNFWTLKAFVYSVGATESRVLLAGFTAVGQSFPFATVGELIHFTLKAKPTATAGRTTINILQDNAGVGSQRTELNEAKLVLNPAPTNAADDSGINPRTGQLLQIDNTIAITAKGKVDPRFVGHARWATPTVPRSGAPDALVTAARPSRFFLPPVDADLRLRMDADRDGVPDELARFRR